MALQAHIWNTFHFLFNDGNEERLARHCYEAFSPVLKAAADSELG